MRKVHIFILILLFIVLAVLSPMVAYAHPGRTDSYGGHMNRKTGEYHYHNEGKSSSSNDNFSVASIILSAIIELIAH